MFDNILDIVKPNKDSDLALLPCPFCGSEEVFYIQYQHDAGVRWKVACMNCLAEIDRGWPQTKSAAQEFWNTRTKL